MNRRPEIENPNVDSRDTNSECDYRFKLKLLGDKGVGKTDLILRYVDNTYRDDYLYNNEWHYKSTSTQVSGNKIKLDIWDTRGLGLDSTYANGAHGVIICYDVTSFDSFDHVKNYLKNKNKYGYSEESKVILVGCKSDLKLKKVVDYETAKGFAFEQGIPFIECSAKKGSGITEVFETLSREILKRAEPKDSHSKDMSKAHDGAVYKPDSSSDKISSHFALKLGASIMGVASMAAFVIAAVALVGLVSVSTPIVVAAVAAGAVCAGLSAFGFYKAKAKKVSTPEPEVPEVGSTVTL